MADRALGYSSSSSRGGYNSGGGGGDAYGPSEARKRDSSSSFSYSNGGVKRTADDGTRVKKFHWDQGPTMNDSTICNTIKP